MTILFPFTLFLALFALVLGEGLCPPNTHVEPCKCRYVLKSVTYDCDNIMDQGTIEGVFKRSLDWPINRLIFGSSSLQYVNTTLIETKDIEHLEIYDSRFTSLFSSTPELGNKIKRIVLWNSTFMRGLNWKFFKNLLLTALDINDVPLTRISNSFVENIQPTLETLYLEKASIRVLHNESFSKLTALKDLNVAQNSIKVIQRSMFPKETILDTLNFRSNKIELLPDDIFSNMPRLSFVFLNNNRIKSFTSGVWERVFHQLIGIRLDGNQILCDCKVKWITQNKFKVLLDGDCDSPDYFKGKNLTDLTEKDFEYCGKYNN